MQAPRREYGQNTLLETDIDSDPIRQFTHWYHEALAANILDANAMVLATVDEKNQPDTRIVLLKNVDICGFVFYTNYQSAKANQIEKNKSVAVNFYWPLLAKQIRIRGTATRINRAESEAYFASRPRDSQLGAHASQQSAVLTNRDELDNKLASITSQFADKPIPCPANWGGYQLIPTEFEFFQGRDNRLSDRLRYTKLLNNTWKIERLSP